MMDKDGGPVDELLRHTSQSQTSLRADWFVDRDLTEHMLSLSRENPAQWVGLAWQANAHRNPSQKDPQDLEEMISRIESVFMQVLHGKNLDVAIAAMDMFRAEMMDLMVRTHLWGAGSARVGVHVTDGGPGGSAPDDGPEPGKPGE